MHNKNAKLYNKNILALIQNINYINTHELTNYINILDNIQITKDKNNDKILDNLSKLYFNQYLEYINKKNAYSL